MLPLQQSASREIAFAVLSNPARAKIRMNFIRISG
jgi:hypothetical protein